MDHDDDLFDDGQTPSQPQAQTPASGTSSTPNSLPNSYSVPNVPGSRATPTLEQQARRYSSMGYGVPHSVSHHSRNQSFTLNSRSHSRTSSQQFLPQGMPPAPPSGYDDPMASGGFPNPFYGTSFMPQSPPTSQQFLPNQFTTPPHGYGMHPQPVFGNHQPSSSGYSTIVDDEADLFYEKLNHNTSVTSINSPMRRSKGVAFREAEPEYPANAYSPRKALLDDANQYDLERIESMDINSVSRGMGGSSSGSHDDFRNSYPMRPYSQMMTFAGEDYLINELEDADEDGDLDFDDDESLFSETGEDLIRRGGTIRRGNTITRKPQKTTLGAGSIIEMEEEDFKPRLNYTKTIKKAKLVNGNYVIDCPTPRSLLDTYGSKITESGREMAFMRYTAATCGPSNFLKFNYNVRQALYNPPRETEILVCITMYNEDEILLAKTLKGVFDNISNLTKRSDPAWGEDSWKKIVVLIVSDGRVALNKRAQSLLSAMGCYQDGYAKSKINDSSVKSHIYEYTSTVGIDIVNERVHLCPNSNPCQMIFCLKEKNQRKINSHRWAFQAFSPILNPRVVMLLDCGTKPSKDAFYYLWRAFRDPTVAGACGEMRASLGQGSKLLANPLVAAQNFEYKISNILDKPMESVFGFITVLPGAFSAYRYEALLNVDGEGPLEKYFKGEYLHQHTQIDTEDLEEDDELAIKERNFQEAGIFTSNMYLAEDRILCFELVAKKNERYVLRYVNEAKAETDVPEMLDEFVLQRRRWLNGSMFAAAYAVFHWTKIWKSDHSLLRKLFLQLEFYYQLVTISVSWFSLASFFLVFRILTANLGAKDMDFVTGKYLAVIFLWFYVGCVVCTFVLAFGNTPRGTRKFYVALASVFSILMVYMMFAAIFLAVHTVKLIIAENKDDFTVAMVFTNEKFRDLVVSVVSTYILYFVGAFLYGEPSFMFTSFVQYVALSPSYINILNIYSFCNIHDVSWGTKGVVQAKDLGSAKSSGANKDELVMVVPGLAEELNDTYLNTLEELRTVPPAVVEINVKKRKDDNYYALVRTCTVLVWMLSNAILIVVVLESGGLDTLIGTPSVYTDGSIAGNSETFLTVILWIVAGLAAFRFIGCVIYLINKVFRPMKWRMLAKKELKKANNSG